MAREQVSEKSELKGLGVVDLRLNGSGIKGVRVNYFHPLIG